MGAKRVLEGEKRIDIIEQSMTDAGKASSKFAHVDPRQKIRSIKGRRGERVGLSTCSATRRSTRLSEKPLHPDRTARAGS